MKTADDSEDVSGKRLQGLMAGGLCGLSVGVLALNDPDAASLFLGIFMGTLLSLKIDCPSHILAAMVFISVIVAGGLPGLWLPGFAVCTAAAYIDEYGNDNPKIYSRGSFFRIFFGYRFSLKIAVAILALLSLGGMAAGTGFRPETFIFFLLFEAAYELAAGSASIKGLRFL
ncbi:hypothetical protein U2150_08615 [Methanothermobacter wolfeii]|uniref:Uncharacterized protein n=1 Tax=Methanothermobacter wolfeii TaxID=145261 RepID=A0ABU8TXG6_METWO|nr:putative protein {ECO:0000313/EMBL:BAM69342,1} [Methanothermobacter wolfeii]